MGNCQDHSVCNGQTDQKELITNANMNVIELIKTQFISEHEIINDQIYGQIQILEKKEKSTEFDFKLAFKQLTITNKEEYKSQLLQQENRFYGLNHPNLLIIHAMENKKLDDFFSQNYQINLYFDYPIRTFQQEMFFRQSTWMAESELLYILDSLVGALSFLQTKGISHLNLSFDNIYIVTIVNGITAIKISDPLLKPEKSSSFERFWIDRNQQFNYFSPEQLSIIASDELQTYNEFKSDVFTLGMLLLELCTLTKCIQVYDIQKWLINEQKLAELLDKVEDRYSEQLVLILKLMLQLNPKKRPDLLELDEAISNYTELANKRIINIWKVEDYQFCIKNEQTTTIKKTSLPLNHPEISSQKHNKNKSSKNLSSKIKKSEQSYQSRKESYLQTIKQRESVIGSISPIDEIIDQGEECQYEGQTLNGNKHGQGKLWDKEGQLIYEGEFEDDNLQLRYHRFGILYNFKCQQFLDPFDYKDFNQLDNKWSRYEGDFLQGQKNDIALGLGQIILGNSERYSGQFMVDQIHGKGVYFTMDGKRIKGQWLNNKLVEELE